MLLKKSAALAAAAGVDPIEFRLKLSRALMRGATDELLARIDQEAKIFSERLNSPEAKAAFEAFFARKR
jgi:hypothetical protein